MSELPTEENLQETLGKAHQLEGLLKILDKFTTDHVNEEKDFQEVQGALELAEEIAGKIYQDLDSGIVAYWRLLETLEQQGLLPGVVAKNFSDLTDQGARLYRLLQAIGLVITGDRLTNKHEMVCIVGCLTQLATELAGKVDSSADDFCLEFSLLTDCKETGSAVPLSGQRSEVK